MKRALNSLAWLGRWKTVDPWYQVATVIVLALMIWGVFLERALPFDWKEFPMRNTDAKAFTLYPRGQRATPMAILVLDPHEELEDVGRKIQALASLGYSVVAFQPGTNDFSNVFGALLAELKRSGQNVSSSMWIGWENGPHLSVFALTNPSNQPALIVHLGSGWDHVLQQISKFSFPKPPSLKSRFIVLPNLLDGKKPDAQEQAIRSANEIGLRMESCPMVWSSEEDSLVLRLVGELGQSCTSGVSWKRSSVVRSRGSAKWRWGVGLVIGVCALRAGWRHGREHCWCQTKTRLLWLGAACSLGVAIGLTFVRTLFRDFPVNAFTLRVSRNLLVMKPWREEFETLVKEPYWTGQKLRDLLTHAELASYTAYKLVNWRVERAEFQEYVLNPVISGDQRLELDWRDPLWRYFYPFIKREGSSNAAATIVVRRLREAVSIEAVHPTTGMMDAWKTGVADPKTFNRLYTAALRSVGVPARYNSATGVEIREDGKWMPAPQPLKFDCLK